MKNHNFDTHPGSTPPILSLSMWEIFPRKFLDVQRADGRILNKQQLNRFVACGQTDLEDCSRISLDFRIHFIFILVCGSYIYNVFLVTLLTHDFSGDVRLTNFQRLTKTYDSDFGLTNNTRVLSVAIDL